ncbi:hypothetical protein [Methanogenium cariaci]|jgi:hypothetical protein
MSAQAGPRKVTVSRETWMRLTARKMPLYKVKTEGQVTYEDVVKDLLDEVEGVKVLPEEVEGVQAPRER